jgi:hypothetical protein
MNNPNEPRTPTQAQIDANRRNAQKSTGPRTPEGKDASSRNRLLHGLRSAKHLVLDESLDDFEDLVKDMQDRFRPTGEAENLLVLRIAADHWRLNRSLPIEAGIYRERFQDLAKAGKWAKEMYDQQLRNGTLRPVPPPEHDDRDLLARAFVLDGDKARSLANLARYENGLEHSIDRCLRHLKIYQDIRLASTPDVAPAEPPRPPLRPPMKPAEPPVPPAETPATPANTADYHSNPNDEGTAQFSPIALLLAILTLLHTIPNFLAALVAPLTTPNRLKISFFRPAYAAATEKSLLSFAAGKADKARHS